MILIADAKDYSHDRTTLGFAILVCLSIPLMLLPLYLVVSPPDILLGAEPAAIALLAGALAVVVFLGIFLKGQGLLFKVPLKVYDEGILLQPSLRMESSIAGYDELSTIEFWTSLERGGWKSGCSVRSANSGPVNSVENFRDAESLKSFIARCRGVLEAKGFRAEPPHETADCARFVFKKPLLPRWRPI